MVKYGGTEELVCEVGVRAVSTDLYPQEIKKWISYGRSIWDLRSR